jgi:hypothetical protein
MPEQHSHTRYTRPDEDGPDIGRYVKAVGDDAKAWFEAQTTVTKLEVSERLGVLSAKALLVVVVMLVVATALVLWFVALAIWLGELLASAPLGFLVAGAIFLLVGVVFYVLWRTVLRDKVTLAVINAIHAKD